METPKIAWAIRAERYSTCTHVPVSLEVSWSGQWVLCWFSLRRKGWSAILMSTTERGRGQANRYLKTDQSEAIQHRQAQHNSWTTPAQHVRSYKPSEAMHSNGGHHLKYYLSQFQVTPLALCYSNMCSWNRRYESDPAIITQLTSSYSPCYCKTWLLWLPS